jgi:hypothetical protein
MGKTVGFIASGRGPANCGGVNSSAAIQAHALDDKPVAGYLLNSAWLTRKAVSASFVFLLKFA